MFKTTDSQTGQVTRYITEGPHTVVQVSQADGTWWNIQVLDTKAAQRRIAAIQSRPSTARTNAAWR